MSGRTGLDFANLSDPIQEVKEKFGQEDSFIARLLLLSHKCESREIAHLLFVGWLDHGCPQYSDSVLIFLDAIDSAVSAHSNTGPPVAHCSAGIGRTGTLIVIDLFVNQIERSGMYNRHPPYSDIDSRAAVWNGADKTYVEWISPQADKCDKEILSELLPLAPPPVPRTHEAN